MKENGRIGLKKKGGDVRGSKGNSGTNLAARCAEKTSRVGIGAPMSMFGRRSQFANGDLFNTLSYKSTKKTVYFDTGNYAAGSFI